MCIISMCARSRMRRPSPAYWRRTAARWVRATNQLVEQAGLPAPQEDPVARRRRLAMLRPAEHTEPGFVPPGLERAVEDRVAATAGPE